MAEKQAALTLKLGNREVRYEADREAVEAQLEHIVGRLLRDVPAAGVTVEMAAPPGASEPPSAPRPQAAAQATEAELLERLYAVSKGGRLTLRKLPARPADALLLVLYGMRKLQNRNWVHAPGMTGAARASGVRFDRADRLLAAYQDLIEGFGKRRAKRYRLTAAGREHCARLVRELAGTNETRPAASEPASPPATDPPAIPQKVTARWSGELLTVAETAELLGVAEAKVRSLRHDWRLLGLPGGTRKRRRFFVPAFQIDAERGEIHPQVREANKLVSRRHTSWGIAEWWNTVEPDLGRKPMELIGTSEADAVVRAAEARFVRHG